MGRLFGNGRLRREGPRATEEAGEALKGVWAALTGKERSSAIRVCPHCNRRVPASSETCPKGHWVGLG